MYNNATATGRRKASQATTKVATTVSINASSACHALVVTAGLDTTATTTTTTTTTAVLH